MVDLDFADLDAVDCDIVAPATWNLVAGTCSDVETDNEGETINDAKTDYDVVAGADCDIKANYDVKVRNGIHRTFNYVILTCHNMITKNP